MSVRPREFDEFQRWYWRACRIISLSRHLGLIIVPTDWSGSRYDVWVPPQRDGSATLASSLPNDRHSAPVSM